MSIQTFSLYKYCEINEFSLKTLATSKIWYSKPAAFNDLFDPKFDMDVPKKPQEIIRYFESRFNNIMAVSQDFLSYVCVPLQDGLGRAPTEKELKRVCIESQEKRLKYFAARIHFYKNQKLSSGEIAEILSFEDGEILNTIQQDIDEAYFANQKTTVNAGILCLSSEPDNNLLWAHYGNNHSGICIGFEMEFDPAGDVELESIHLPLDVEYSDERPVIDPSSFFVRENKSVFTMFKLFFCQKSSEWSYEKEIRMVSREGDMLYPVPGRIAEVTFGARVGHKEMETVIKASLHQKGIEYYKIIPDTATRSLQRAKLVLNIELV